MEPVVVCGKEKNILSADRDRIISPNTNERKLILLGGHDPYLDQRDRKIILAEKSLHKMVWKTTTNPGVILKDGEISGIWTGRKQNQYTDFKMFRILPFVKK